MIIKISANTLIHYFFVLIQFLINKYIQVHL